MTLSKESPNEKGVTRDASLLLFIKCFFYFLNIIFSLLNMTVSKQTPLAVKSKFESIVKIKGTTRNSPPKSESKILTEL